LCALGFVGSAVNITWPTPRMPGFSGWTTRSPTYSLRFGDACHYGAAISLTLDKTFCFQPLQGFSNGDFTDVQQLRYVILTDRLVLIQLTGEHRFANMFRDYIRGR
jgi:hypothetical protein